MRIRRRTAVVLTASLAVHALMFGAWMTKRALVDYAEPPPIQVELLRPQRPPKPRPKPPSRSPNATPTGVVPHLPPALTQPAAPTAPAPSRPPLDTRQMTDQELLERAGPRPDMARLYEEDVKRPVFSRRLPPGPFDCKPASEHSDRIAPPCPAYAGPPPKPLNPLANRPDLAGLVATKDAFKAYGERYGPHGMANPHDFPGMGCKTLHTHCGPEPEDPGANGSTIPRR